MNTLLQHSVMVDARNIDVTPPIKNPAARMWKSTLDSLVGIHDLRARLGSFETPWCSPSNKLYSAPEFKFIDDSLSDLLDRRATEILAAAKTHDKKVMALWSGGIDSTAVLVSLIKNWSASDLGLLTVVLNTSSMVENFEFYQKFISNKIKCLHYSKLDVTDQLLSKNILVHGDPADCLYGPSTGIYKQMLINGEHQDSYKKHLEKMAALCQPPEHLPYSVPGFGKWFVDKVTDNLEQVRAENVTTVTDWWWWTYYNFKWEFSCQRPFIFSKKDTKASISLDNQKFFAEHTFYNTDYFQQWSYSNLKNLFKDGMKSHKLEAKRYIFEFDKNEFYLNNKSKLAGAPADATLRVSADLPLCYDQNWVGYHRWGHSLNEQAVALLEKYKG